MSTISTGVRQTYVLYPQESGRHVYYIHWSQADMSTISTGVWQTCVLIHRSQADICTITVTLCHLHGQTNFWAEFVLVNRN